MGGLPTLGAGRSPRTAVVVSRVLLAVLFLGVWIPIGRWEASATGDRWAIDVEGSILLVSGPVISSGTWYDDVPRWAEQRAIELQHLPFGFPYWLIPGALVAGFLLAGRPGTGARLGALSALVFVFTLRDLEEGLRLQFDSYAWPGELSLQFTSNLSVLRTGAGFVILWHFLWYLRERRPQSPNRPDRPGPELIAARS